MYWVFSMAQILHKPYTDQYNWWAPVELVRRSVFIIAITAAPGNLVRFNQNATMVWYTYIMYISSPSCGQDEMGGYHIILGMWHVYYDPENGLGGIVSTGEGGHVTYF